MVYLKPLFSLNNSSNKFFMTFLLTDNESLKFLLLIISTLLVLAYPLSTLSFLEILIPSQNGNSRNNSWLLNFLIRRFLSAAYKMVVLVVIF